MSRAETLHEELMQLESAYNDAADAAEGYEADLVDARAQIVSLTALIASLEAERQWQPIETVPKDHFARLVYSMDGGGTMVAFVDVTGQWFSFPSCNECVPLRFIPTHWMPLPERPKNLPASE